MSIRHLSASDAHLLQQGGHTYVDVRSSSEFTAGHPAGAVNVPVFEPDEDSGQMAPNPDFIRVMQANFATDAKLLVGCQAGMRSLRAAQMLDAFGYTNIVNVTGGFGGAHDRASGRVIDPGWHASGLPVETAAPSGARYDDLLKKADVAGT
jgi:rhodanese-related sulfurtransferase